MRPPRERWVLLGVVAWLAVMLAGAAPRSVGDASEYVGMAINLAHGRPPSLSEDDMRAFREVVALPDRGFELQTRQLPELRGADGRYDMPHMWIYPALAVPGVWLAGWAGISPAWGLVLTNLTLLAALLTLIVWRGGAAWSLSLVATPIVWWLDKPLADVLIACGLGAATLLFPSHSGVALVLLGLLAAQNPALVAVCAIFGIAAVVVEPRRLRDPRWLGAAAGGAACAAIAPLYYLSRLDRLSPLTSFTTFAWPGWTALTYPLLDVNMGLLVRFPVTLLLLWPLARPAGWRAQGVWPSALTAIALLAICSQQPNMNQGGNPDLSRYAIWLLPLTLPWLLAADADASGERGIWLRRAGLTCLALTMLWTTIAFPLSRPESYRYPTPLATWLWTQHPAWTTPRVEAFAERVSHREPGVVPTALPGCEKVLLHEGLWPTACPPLDDVNVPADCFAPGAFCYANQGTDGQVRFTTVGVVPGLHLDRHERGWRAGEDAAAWVARALHGMTGGAALSTHVSVRAVWKMAWTQTWSHRDGRLTLYARDVAPGGALMLRMSTPTRVRVSTPGAFVSEQALDVTRDEPARLALPAARHVLVEFTPSASMPDGPASARP